MDPGTLQLGWNRDLDSLAGTSLEPNLLWTFTGTGSSLDLHWNRNSKGRIRKFVETSGNWFPCLVRPTNGPGYTSGTDHQPVYPKRLRDGHVFQSCQAPQFHLGPCLVPLATSSRKNRSKDVGTSTGLPQGEIRGELENSRPCRFQNQNILEGGREDSRPCRVQK